MAENLEEEMVATYGVSIIGVQRTKAQLARLSKEIALLRSTNYSPTATVSEARFGTSRADKMLGGKNDIFAAKVDMLEGNVQTVASRAMASAMAKGKQVQTATLRAATTEKGASGKPNGRKSAGREVTGTMIRAIATNVETQRTAAVTSIVGWHGWRRHRTEYMEYQEQGTKGRKSGQKSGSVNRKVKKKRDGVAGRGVPAANSLGASIVIVREYLKRELEKIRG